MAQQRGMKRAAKVLKRKQKSARLKHDANVRRQARGPVAQAHDHDHEGHEDHEGHKHEQEEKKITKKKSTKQEE